MMSKGHRLSNEVQIPDNCDDLGIAIWLYMYGRHIEGVTLERT